MLVDKVIRNCLGRQEPRIFEITKTLETRYSDQSLVFVSEF